MATAAARFSRQRLVHLRRAGRVGVGEHVDIGLVAGLHRPRDLEQGRVELRLHARASGIEGQRRRDADDDPVADLQHVEPDAGGLPAQLAVEIAPCRRPPCAGLSGRILAARIFAARAREPPITSADR